ncbi:class I SAM-dependent methyltransferase [Sphingobium sp. HBC34]|uniref:Class I SAM-dependent methyltransferase n=1 Tax=Sphingobium cyanobacteriorum TaxID=3063954 RepID=A0ABT8ZRZ4_9SPHN|nr:class I SAM-dependent methyltransferase [Sphingobium sp. HBC34]MDO7837305.1 class I SAM-dependent methyltransferase [Sphingobium sp. HBC34]
MTMWHALGRQLGNPQGMAGAWVGRIMRIANDRPTRIAVDALDLHRHEVALDLGCGSGHAIALMAQRARCIYGIDQSAVMVRQAGHRNRAAIRAGRVSVTTGRFAALPYPDASFDKILASNVVYFWQDEQAVLAEVRRVLRPGGMLSIYVTDAATMRQWKFACSGTHRHFTAGDLARLLTDAGFDGDAIEVRPVAISRTIQGLLATAHHRAPCPASS